MKKVKVSELKARLSSYLAEVRKGDTVMVCERATPIALLVPLAEEPVQIREPERPWAELGMIRPVRLRRKVDVDKILSEMRGDR